MSNKATDIFKQLQQYEAPVPEHVWQQIAQRLFTEEQGMLGKLTLLEQTVPHSLYTAVTEQIAEEQLTEKAKALAALEIFPAEEKYKQLQLNKDTPQAAVFTLLHRPKWLYVAAMLLVVTAAFITIRLQLSNGKEQVLAEHGGQRTQQALPAKAVDTVQTIAEEPVDNAVKNQETVVVFTGARYYMDVPVVTVMGKRLPVNENDLLFSFAAVNPALGRRYFTTTYKNPVIVSLDDYTNIQVSDYMSKQLLLVFKTKRNGKPAFAAKRAKNRINQWRNADSKVFDNSKTKNPLDLIDLTETIF